MKTIDRLRPVQRSRAMRFVQFPVTRIVLAAFCVALAAALAYSLAEAVAPPSLRVAWPHLLAAVAVLLAYGGYARVVETKWPPEFGLRGALRESAAGLGIGAAAVVAVLLLLAAGGVYRPTAPGAWRMVYLWPLAEMLFVSVFEEVLCRAIIFRIAEQSLGSRAALIISALLFGLAHIPGNGIGALAFVVAMVAGLVFTFAFMLTRRLWLCVAIHCAWNYTLGSVFSIVVSGHPAKGWINGTLEGPNWITGGAYGVEGSAVTLLVLSAIGIALFRCVSRKRQVASHLQS